MTDSNPYNINPRYTKEQNLIEHDKRDVVYGHYDAAHELWWGGRFTPDTLYFYCYNCQQVRLFFYYPDCQGYLCHVCCC